MLRLGHTERLEIWEELGQILENYAATVDELPVAPDLNPEAIRALLAPCDFTRPMNASEALRFAANGLQRFQVHTPHPRYYGLFNPAPTTMGIAADAMVAGFNPQLAAWSHSPFAAEVEMHVIRALGSRFGYSQGDVDGVFASGGMEANHTALLCALTNRFPGLADKGLRSLDGQPVFYCSSESHHSLLKAALMCGLGMDAVRLIDVDGQLKMKAEALQDAIAHDTENGFVPFLVVGTAGTTSTGAIDPLPDLAAVAGLNNIWFHVDAAWGGGAAFVPELQALLKGIDSADSITFDAHKWLSVPMGAGVFLTRHQTILDRTFRVATSYMPKDAAGLDIVDPHLHSMQWSRRFIGLKVFLSLLAAGWEGYADAIRHQTRMGVVLRAGLEMAGWEMANETPLPVVCFAKPGATSEEHQEIVSKIVRSGKAWISTTVLAGRRTVLRACITNYRTQESDISALIRDLSEFV
ncbi:MAG: aminotransferase class V-fold PLP-dependent enzyme [Bryobacteraceae bacterium]